MAQPNILVISVVFIGFTIQLLNFVLFFIEVVYWFGHIWNVIGIYLSIYLFVRASCI